MVKFTKILRKQNSTQASTNQLQFFLFLKVFLDFHRRPTTFLDMVMIGQMTKLRVIRKSVGLGLYRMEVVKFTDDIYRSLSDDIMHLHTSALMTSNFQEST